MLQPCRRVCVRAGGPVCGGGCGRACVSIFIRIINETYCLCTSITTFVCRCVLLYESYLFSFWENCFAEKKTCSVNCEKQVRRLNLNDVKLCCFYKENWVIKCCQKEKKKTSSVSVLCSSFDSNLVPFDIPRKCFPSSS